MKRMLVMVFVLAFAVTAFGGEIATKTYGKAPTVTDPTAISMVKSTPDNYKDQTVLVTGKIVDVCKHAGCWVEIEAADSARVICKSLDESVRFPKDVVGKTIALQGKVMYDSKAPGTVAEKHEGGEAHACPAPQVLISIDGATVADATTAIAAPVEEKKE